MEERFRTRPGGFNEIKKRMFIRRIPIALVAVLGGFIIVARQSNSLSGNEISLGFVIIGCLAVLFYGWYASIKRNRAIFNSYVLTINDNSILREEMNTPAIRIPFSNIQEIARNRNNSFTIRSRVAADVIFIPAQIEDYGKVEAWLNRIMPITRHAVHPLKRAYIRLLPLLIMGLMLAVYLSDNRVVMLTGGSLLAVQMVWLFYKVRRSKNIDSQTKRTMWLIIFVLGSVIATIILKLM